MTNLDKPTDSGLKARPLLFLYDLPDGGKLRLVKESAFDQEHARAETAEAKLHALESQLKQAKTALEFYAPKCCMSPCDKTPEYCTNNQSIHHAHCKDHAYALEPYIDHKKFPAIKALAALSDNAELKEKP